MKENKELIEKQIEEDKEKDKKIVKEATEKLKHNRKTRRSMNKNVHHNVFTKKYKSVRARESAWKTFLGPIQFVAFKKLQKKMTRKAINDDEVMKKQFNNIIEENNKFDKIKV